MRGASGRGRRRGGPGRHPSDRALIMDGPSGLPGGKDRLSGSATALPFAAMVARRAADHDEHVPRSVRGRGHREWSWRRHGCSTRSRSGRPTVASPPSPPSSPPRSPPRSPTMLGGPGTTPVRTPGRGRGWLFSGVRLGSRVRLGSGEQPSGAARPCRDHRRTGGRPCRVRPPRVSQPRVRLRRVRLRRVRPSGPVRRPRSARPVRRPARATSGRSTPGPTRCRSGTPPSRPRCGRRRPLRHRVPLRHRAGGSCRASPWS